MITEARVRQIIDKAIDEFTASESFQDLVSGRLSVSAMRQFIRACFLPHYQSTRVLAFEYSVHGGPQSELLQHNMLEEMGLDDEGISHPSLLEDLALGAGYSPDEVTELIEASGEYARAYYAQQIAFPTLRDLGLAILLESSAFECFLSRHADQIGSALEQHFGFPKERLRWFALHGELDVRHAEEALSVVRGYVDFHRLDDAHFERIARATFAHSPFLSRYFADSHQAMQAPQAPGAFQASRAPSRLIHAQPTEGQISAVTIYRLDIPFRSAFRHALANRTASDSVIVCIQDSAGVRGYGEGIAREYVTGETTATMAEVLATALAPRLLGHVIDDDWSLATLRDLFRGWLAAMPALKGGAPPNAACCALELAIIDWLLRRSRRSAADVLPPARQEVEYSGVIPVEGLAEVAALARRFTEFGIARLKVKVGVGDDLARLRTAREVAGEGAQLRVDANGAWSAEEAIERLRLLQTVGIECVEQPVSAAAGVNALRRVREATGLPIAADESLVTVDDARKLAAAHACDIFNIRVSKNGGLTGALAIAEVAEEAGIRVQVGAQVGETAILTAAGRHLAAHVPDLVFAEGSFGTLLLQEDIAEQELRFGPGGLAPILRGPGLGVECRHEQIERFAVEIIEVRG